MKNKIDMTGAKIGRILVLSEAPLSRDGRTNWNCVCECGTKKIMSGKVLRRKSTVSCGCYGRALVNGGLALKHGATKNRKATNLYTRWLAMKARCYDEKSQYYSRYGGRGISVCKDWKDSFEAFKLWAESNGFEDKLILDRVDFDLGYSPTNCRWVTAKESANNTSRTVFVEVLGVGRVSLSAAAEKFGVPLERVRDRLNLGWDIDSALRMPKNSRRPK